MDTPTWDLHGISPAGDSLIIDEETGGQEYYEKTEMHPDWPGGASGVTIGNGYDCGYSDAATIAADWGPYLNVAAVQALQAVAGVHGSPAQSEAHALHWITVPWDAAMAVFHNRDLPKWMGICEQDLPNFDQLNGDCRGALLSLAFNRGDSWNIPAERDPSGRYTEMRAIKTDMENGTFDAIPAEIRAMKRLWPLGSVNHNDLTNRREHEALLFEHGIANMAQAAVT